GRAVPGAAGGAGDGGASLDRRLEDGGAVQPGSRRPARLLAGHRGAQAGPDPRHLARPSRTVRVFLLRSPLRRSPAMPDAPDACRPLPLAARSKIDGVCDVYETLLRGGEQPRVEDFVGHLQCELVKIEREYRQHDAEPAGTASDATMPYRMGEADPDAP